MNFENMICDGCGRKFEKDDDIVVCPECGTPQHRSCFENCGGCVNSSKHAIGFVWQKEETKTEVLHSDTNASDSNEGNNPKEIDLKPGSSFLGTMDPGIGDTMNPEEITGLDDLIESRVRVIAPGITPEQRTEQLCGEEIGTTISFIGSNAAVYVKKFRKREHQHKFTFNWAAFFFTPIWFFYRKLYKAGAVYISLLVSITMLMAQPAENFLSIYQGLVETGVEAITEADYAALSAAIAPILVFEAVTLLIHLIAGLTADKMYWSYCKKTLEKVRQARGNDEFFAFSHYLRRCSVSFIAGLAAMVAYSFLPQLLVSLF